MSVKELQALAQKFAYAFIKQGGQWKMQKNINKCSKCQCVRTPNDFVCLVAKRELASLQWLPWRLPSDEGMSG